MGFFIVHLKEGSELLKIEADKFYIEDGVFLFYKDGGGEISLEFQSLMCCQL